MKIIPSVILFAAVSANCMAATVADSTVHNMSVDCDCDSHPADPKLKDMGILASTDPVALDQACLNLVSTTRLSQATTRNRLSNASTANMAHTSPTMLKK